MTANRSDGAHAETAQTRREPRDAVEMLAEGRAVVAVEEADAIGVALDRGQQQAVIDELLHDTSPSQSRPPHVDGDARDARR